MSRSIQESDWKLFRQVRTLALDRLCQRILDEVTQIATDTTLTAHNRYLKIFDILKKRDRIVGDCFDMPRRSTAMGQLISICSHGLLTQQEIEQFKPETRDMIARFSTDPS